MIDEHTSQLRTDSLLNQRCSNRGVDATGQATKNLFVTNQFADLRDLLVNKVRAGPGLGAASNVVKEVLDDLLALLAVGNLRVPLDGGEAALGILESRNGRAWPRKSAASRLPCC